MSFQDVGRNNSRRQPANATFQTNARPAPPMSGGGWGGPLTSESSSVTQISEALLQYQVSVCSCMCTCMRVCVCMSMSLFLRNGKWEE